MLILACCRRCILQRLGSLRITWCAHWMMRRCRRHLPFLNVYEHVLNMRHYQFCWWCHNYAIYAFSHTFSTPSLCESFYAIQRATIIVVMMWRFRRCIPFVNRYGHVILFVSVIRWCKVADYTFYYETFMTVAPCCDIISAEGGAEMIFPITEDLVLLRLHFRKLRLP